MTKNSVSACENQEYEMFFWISLSYQVETSANPICLVGIWGWKLVINYIVPALNEPCLWWNDKDTRYCEFSQPDCRPDHWSHQLQSIKTGFQIKERPNDIAKKPQTHTVNTPNKLALMKTGNNSVFHKPSFLHKNNIN